MKITITKKMKFNNNNNNNNKKKIKNPKETNQISRNYFA